MEVCTIEKEINDALVIANKISITTNEEESFAVEFLKIIKAAQKQVSDEFDAGVEDAHSLHKKLVAQRKKYLDPLKDAEENVRQLIKAYRLELELKRKEEQEKSQAMIDAQVKSSQDKLMAEAEAANAAGDTAKADQLAVQSTKIEAGGVLITSTATKQEGMSSKIVWKARVVDQTVLPKEFLIITVNQKALDEFAKKNENKIPLAGCEFYQDVDLRVRS